MLGFDTRTLRNQLISKLARISARLTLAGQIAIFVNAVDGFVNGKTN
jgi:hypothetical protein